MHIQQLPRTSGSNSSELDHACSRLHRHPGPPFRSLQTRGWATARVLPSGAYKLGVEATARVLPSGAYKLGVEATARVLPSGA